MFSDRCRTYGAHHFLLLNPALTGWAKQCRASGAPMHRRYKERTAPEAAEKTKTPRHLPGRTLLHQYCIIKLNFVKKNLQEDFAGACGLRFSN
jgi:hypothetical protein